MRSMQTSFTFPLSAVKPLDGLMAYRAHCLAATRAALSGGATRRDRSPVSGEPLEPAGDVEGLPYGRCPATGSLFLTELPAWERWMELLAEVNRYRHSPEAFHTGLAQSRVDNVYAPRLEWIEDTLQLHQLDRPKVLEVTTPPSDVTKLLAENPTFSEVITEDEMRVAHAFASKTSGEVGLAVLFEVLDRVDDPVALLRGVASRLAPGGLVFVTALVSSGFDLAVLGLRNLYLYPPDRTNCFSLLDLSNLLERTGFTLVEASTPGVLDVEIVRAHVQRSPAVALSPFERQLIAADVDTHAALQALLQERGLSSFARLVGRRTA